MSKREAAEREFLQAAIEQACGVAKFNARAEPGSDPTEWDTWPEYGPLTREFLLAYHRLAEAIREEGPACPT